MRIRQTMFSPSLFERSTIRVEEKDNRLSPGMAVAVEIKTGKRRLIECFLTPLLQAARNSVRER